MEQQGALISSVIWQTRQIHVCSESVMPTEMNWVREIVDSTWGAESSVNFYWYTNTYCNRIPQDRRDIRITWGDGCGQHNSQYGTNIDDMVGGMILFPCNHLDADSRKKTVQWMAVHEFGHALAFIHEHARPNATTCQGQIDFQNPGMADTFVGAYDIDSVMNYCSGSGIGLGNNYGRLSGIDIQSAGNYYAAAFPFTAVGQASGRIDLLARQSRPIAPQVNGGNVSVRTYTPDVGWSGWLSLGSVDGQAPTSAPTAVAPSSSRMDVFVRTSTATIAQNTRNGESWSGWSNIGGNTIGQPVVVSRGPNQLTVLTRNINYGLSVREWDGIGWGSWIAIPSSPSSTEHFVGVPAATVGADGAVNVFVQWSDRSLRTIRSAAIGAWPTSWTNLGGSILSSPAPVAIKGTSNVAVFVRTSDGRIQSRELDGNLVWSSWLDHGWPVTGVSGSPSVVSRDSNFIDLVIREPAYGRVYHRQRNVFGWGDWQMLPFSTGTFGSPYIVAGGASWLQIFALSDVWYDFPVQNIQWRPFIGWTNNTMSGNGVY